MSTMVHRFLGALIIGSSVFLSGCGDKQQPSAQRSALVDPLAPKYESTLAEGIDFKKAGYPNFLIEVSGMSGREDWGRWTDANLGSAAKFRFSKPLPEKFILEIQANGIGDNVGKPSKIRVGNVEKEIVVKNWNDESIYQITFDGPVDADMIEIIPVSPLLPQNTGQNGADSRRLGLGLISLKVKVLN